MSALLLLGLKYLRDSLYLHCNIIPLKTARSALAIEHISIQLWRCEKDHLTNG